MKFGAFSKIGCRLYSTYSAPNDFLRSTLVNFRQKISPEKEEIQIMTPEYSQGKINQIKSSLRTKFIQISLKMVFCPGKNEECPVIVRLKKSSCPSFVTA